MFLLNRTIDFLMVRERGREGGWERRGREGRWEGGMEGGREGGSIEYKRDISWREQDHKKHTHCVPAFLS